MRNDRLPIIFPHFMACFPHRPSIEHLSTFYFLLYTGMHMYFSYIYDNIYENFSSGLYLELPPSVMLLHLPLADKQSIANKKKKKKNL